MLFSILKNHKNQTYLKKYYSIILKDLKFKVTHVSENS